MLGPQGLGLRKSFNRRLLSGQAGPPWEDLRSKGKAEASESHRTVFKSSVCQQQLCGPGKSHALSLSVPPVPDGDNAWAHRAPREPTPPASPTCPQPESSLSAWAPGRGTEKGLSCRGGGEMRNRDLRSLRHKCYGFDTTRCSVMI